jgi:NTE family protein
MRRISITSLTVALSLTLASTSHPLRAEEQLQQDRPKIGLALGGGGAKGGAHVGVLKVFEELNIPIDYIAGTSIGGIVGGLYATGMTADELAETISSIDWNEALQDKPPRRDLSFRKKEENARYLFDLEVGVGKGGIKWPSGFISGQNLFFLLQSLTLNAANVTDFHELPIPFEAVATNVRTGEMAILDRGYLATALRATMAIPGVFSPVAMYDTLMVDGGLVNNLPVDVVKAMGADIVIAVDLGAELDSRDVGESMIQVYQQTMRMLTRPNVRSRIEMADLVINPGVSDFGTMSFGEIVEIMEQGYAVAAEMADELSKYSIDPASYASLRARQKRRTPEPTTIAFVEFEGNERVDDRVVDRQILLEPGTTISFELEAEDIGSIFESRSRREKRLQRQVDEGEPIGLRSLFLDLRRLYGLGDFQTVDFSFEDRGDETGIIIGMREKPWGPNFLHFGLEIASDLKGDTNFELLVNLTKTRINRRGAEWRNDVIVGNDLLLVSELYQPLDFAGDWFFAPRLRFGEERFKFWDEGEAVADLNIGVLEAGLDLGYAFNRMGEIRAGVVAGNADVEVETGSLPPDLPEEDEPGKFALGGLRLLGRWDNLDNVNVPRGGSGGRVFAYQSLEELGADRDYWKAGARGSLFLGGGKHTGILGYELGWSDGEVPVYDEFYLGGLGSLSGYAPRELRGQYAGVGRLGYYHQTFKSWFLGGWLEAGNVFQETAEITGSNLIYSGTVILAKDSSFGPIYLAYGYADTGDNRIYLQLGRVFSAF